MSPWRQDYSPERLGAYPANRLDNVCQVADAVSHESTWALVLLLSWVFGQKCANFVCTMLRLAVQRDELKVVADQLGGPTSAEPIAYVLSYPVEAAIANRHPLR